MNTCTKYPDLEALPSKWADHSHRHPVPAHLQDVAGSRFVRCPCDAPLEPTHTDTVATLRTFALRFDSGRLAS